MPQGRYVAARVSKTKPAPRTTATRDVFDDAADQRDSFGTAVPLKDQFGPAKPLPKQIEKQGDVFDQAAKTFDPDAFHQQYARGRFDPDAFHKQYTAGGKPNASQFTIEDPPANGFTIEDGDLSQYEVKGDDDLAKYAVPDDRLDVVQHPTLGTLKFPKEMPYDQRNQIIDGMETDQLKTGAGMEQNAQRQASAAIRKPLVRAIANRAELNAPMPGSFEGHPENIGEYVPQSIGRIATGASDIGHGRIARGAHEMILGAGHALAPVGALAAGGALLPTAASVAGGLVADTWAARRARGWGFLLIK